MRPLSAGHAASLATTAGITAVITGVVVASILGQCANLAGTAAHLAAISLFFLSLAIGSLYGAREAIGQALDLMASEPQLARIPGLRGLFRYHLGMAGLFAGMSFAAAWRFLLPQGAFAWSVVLVLGGLAIIAFLRAYRCWQELERSRHS